MNTNTSIKFARQVMHFSALIIFLSTFVAPAEASTLVIGVKKATSDEYIAGAKVCVGSATSAFMYGVVFTGPANQALPSFEIPDNVATVSVTITKEGYQGLRQTVSLSRSGQNVTRQILLRLAEGSGGPTCQAVPGPADRMPVSPPSIPRIPIAITSFQINGGQTSTTDRIVRLDVSYGGTPTHYQVSESSDFSGAPWKDISGSGNQLTYNFDAYAINVPTSMSPTRRAGPVTTPLRPGQIITRPSAEKYGTRTLYFRLKNAEFTSGKRNDTIELKPTLKRYFVSGDELKELLNYAKEQGFSFDSSVTGESGCLTGFDGIDFEIPGMKLAAYAECYLGISNSTRLVYTRVLKTTFFGGRDLNTSWRIKENPVFGPKDLWNEANPDSDSSWTITKQPANHDPSFTVEFKFTRKPQEHPVYTFTTIATCQALRCRPASIQLIGLSLEGPEDDNWVDPNKKWKNAFRQQ